MTRALRDARSVRPAELPQPTPADVIALQAVRSYPAVSVLCTPEPAQRMPAADAATLTGLATRAADRVAREFGAAATAPISTRLRELVADAATRPTRAAVAVHVCAHDSSAWALTVEVPDRAVVDPTFATRDLVRSLHRTPRHVLLVLTSREAKLFDGHAGVLVPAPASAFPMPCGDRDRDSFLRAVDRALGTHLRVHPAPLVLAGDTRVVAAFARLSRNTRRLAGTVRGSHARTSLADLARRVRPVLDRYLHSREAEALRLVEQRAGSRRVVTGMPSVWLAARAERPEMLAVEEGLFHPARVVRDGDLLLPATDVEHPDVLDDAVDEVVETVLQRGGWVAWVSDGALAHADRVALTLRDR
ncbi:hypothetical protein ACI8AF_04400 [Blastococcus sp. SYSU D00669]